MRLRCRALPAASLPLFDPVQHLVLGLGGTGHAGEVVMALGGTDGAVAEQGGDDADLLGGGRVGP
jgi:hypothetical protein